MPKIDAREHMTRNDFEGLGRKSACKRTIFIGFIVALVLVGCNNETPPQPETVVIEVDGTLTPPVASLPPLGGAPRPVAVLEDQDGLRAAFVADELWIATDDRASLDALLGRWSGVILLELQPAESGVGALARQYLVRIDATRGETSGLPADLQTLEAGRRGNARVSSQEALGLIAASASEAVAGHDVGINWVGSGADAAPSKPQHQRSPKRPILGRSHLHPEPVCVAHARRRKPSGYRRRRSMARARFGRTANLRQRGDCHPGHGIRAR